MGYSKIITYTLEEESGASLKAIGARPVAQVNPGLWDRPNRFRKHDEVYMVAKIRWELLKGGEG